MAGPLVEVGHRRKPPTIDSLTVTAPDTHGPQVDDRMATNRGRSDEELNRSRNGSVFSASEISGEDGGAIVGLASGAVQHAGSE
jgi:hypothetical protein